MSSLFKQKPWPWCLVDGKPYYGNAVLELGAKFIGQEKEINARPRYVNMYHPWFNLSCYETEPGAGRK